MQERVQATVIESYIEHKLLDEYLVNTHAFHNAHLIREALPQNLMAPIPFCIDRHSYHLGISPQLRTKQDAKRAATALKKAETTKAAAEKNKSTTVTVGRKRTRTELEEEPQDSDHSNTNQQMDVDKGLLVGET